MFRQHPNVPAAPPALGQGGWGPRGQGLGGYNNQGLGGGMGIYQGAGQGYPDSGMGMRAGGFQGGFPSGLNPDLPFYRGQPPPDYGGYQVSAAYCQLNISWNQFYEFPDGRSGDGRCSISRQATVPPTSSGKSTLVR